MITVAFGPVGLDSGGPPKRGFCLWKQSSTQSRHRGDGTGLGLPLTKAMVDANRATFSINSAPNEGTLVEITFPSPRVLAG